MNTGDNNQDLQATHKVLQLIESSKRQGERILDTIPGLFAVINSYGEILRSNQVMADYFHKDSEDLLYLSLSEIFKQEEWNMFSNEISELESSESESVDFELSMTDSENVSQPHLWYVAKFRNDKGETDDSLFTVVGKDISELKAAQQNLVEVFSSVPLGILTVTAGGEVKGQVSKYSEFLFSGQSIEGSTINDLLFNKIKGLTRLEEESIDSMISNIGQQELIFSVIKDDLPSRVLYKNEETEKWLSLTFQPITYEGLVQKILVILQDITQLVKAEQASKNQNLLEEQSIARIVQIKKMDLDTKPFIFEEVSGLFNQIEEAIELGDVRKVCNYLHGVKGCARVSGLTFLTEKTHSVESVLLNLDDNIDDPKETLSKNLAEVIEEWKEVFSLDKALSLNKPEDSENVEQNNQSENVRHLFVEYNKLIQKGIDISSRILAKDILTKLESYNRVNTIQLDSILENTVTKTSEELEKKINLDISWDNVYVSQEQLHVLRETLVHLLNNSVDHGIESGSDRLRKKKRVVGTIKVVGSDSKGTINIDVSDDGAGIDIEKIRDVAIRKEMFSLEEALALTDDQVMELLFSPKFTSKEEVTQVSGRGIGLDAVREAVTNIGGEVSGGNSDVGTVFTIKIPSERTLYEAKGTAKLQLFLDHFQDQIARLEQDDIKINLEIEKELLVNKNNWRVHVEFDSILFAIVKIIETCALQDANNVLLQTKDGGILELVIDSEKELDLFGDDYCLDTCLLLLNQHLGGVEQYENKIHIQFRYLQKD
jgi:HPt (histidine-containing phosphotransfer) domain-containing protein